MQFERAYDKEPNIIISASHSSEGNNLKPAYMSVTAWIEVWLILKSFKGARRVFIVGVVPYIK